MTRRVRWGVLGTARIAAKLLPPLQSLPRHQVVAVASRDEARARAFAQRWGIPHAVSPYESLIARDDIDVVYIPLPNAQHAEWTIRAARAGKHVLCEKPLATSVADVEAVMEAAHASGVRVSEAFMYRHHPQTARVMDLVTRGDLGDVRLVRGCFSFTLDEAGRCAVGAAAGWRGAVGRRLLPGQLRPHAARSRTCRGRGDVGTSCVGRGRVLGGGDALRPGRARHVRLRLSVRAAVVHGDRRN